jgi:8-oxo-dGTP diphosphatase
VPGVRGPERERESGRKGRVRVSSAQAVIVRGNDVLMVKDRVDRGDIVWNFPGGGVDEGETPEEACIREMKEETGLDIRITELLDGAGGRYTYLAEIVGGKLRLDAENEPTIIEIAWVSLHDDTKFDGVTTYVRDLCLPRFGRTQNAQKGR